jgi:NTE family protein
LKISLALGGGGVRGNAHIGVLRVLEQRGYQIEAMAGTSMGGLIGAVYLAGNTPDDIEERLANADFRTLFRRGSDVQNALLGQTGLVELLHEYLGELSFEELPIPFAVPAVDLVTGLEVVLKTGRLLDAVLATTAVPGVFPPRIMGDYELVDGGLSNPVPVALARSLAPRLPVIAVAMTRPPEPHRHLPQSSIVPSMPVLDRLTQFRIGQAFSVFTRSISISGRLLAELRLAVEKPELIIRPDVDEYGILDRVDVHEMVARGEAAAEIELSKWELRNTLSFKAALAFNRLFKRN